MILSDSIAIKIYRQLAVFINGKVDEIRRYRGISRDSNKISSVNPTNRNNNSMMLLPINLNILL
jgi:hypothetical protein